MSARIVSAALVAALLAVVPAFAQGVAVPSFAGPYVDPIDGLLLEDAIARAREQEPALRAARTEIDVARGMRQQATLRLNPTISFERREEPSGTDNQTTVAVEWPLDLFRKGERVAVADRTIAATELGVADRERLLAAAVRTRYGEVLAAVRSLAVFDEAVAATRRQHALLRSRVEAGSTPPLERDLLDVELRRLESDRLLQAGRTDAALTALKRALGMRADATLRVRDTLEDRVRLESSTAPPVPQTERVIEQRIDVRAAAARVDLAGAKIDRAQAEGRIGVSLFGNYMRTDAGFP
ncbi:MAG TPA: TolC family protein, partial [Vicinamibacterales bacterium]|nr:TolC family protein [Vicinamibacterales bacterium]